MKKIIILFLISTYLFANNSIIFYPLFQQGLIQEEDNQLTNAQISEPKTEEAYRIEPGDVLEIVILGEEGFSRTIMVMRNGNISYPFIGDIKVSGLTTEEAVALVSEKLKKYFIQPVVSIILQSPTSPYISIFGEVRGPGAFSYQRGLRVSDYIALAGGPAAGADMKKVRVIRFQAEKSVISTVNVDEILKKGLSEENYELKSGDWIYVSERFTINWGTILQIVTFTATVLNLYLTIESLRD